MSICLVPSCDRDRFAEGLCRGHGGHRANPGRLATLEATMVPTEPVTAPLPGICAGCGTRVYLHSGAWCEAGDGDIKHRCPPDAIRWAS